MSDIRTTAKDVGSYVGGKTYFGSDPKEEYKSELWSSQEPCKEEEDKATLPGCEAENLVEEKDTLVSLREDGNVKNMDDKGYDFCSNHYYLQPYDSWDIENITLAYEDYRMKDMFPPFTHLGHVVEIFKPLSVSLGASLESRLSPCY